MDVFPGQPPVIKGFDLTVDAIGQRRYGQILDEWIIINNQYFDIVNYDKTSLRNDQATLNTSWNSSICLLGNAYSVMISMLSRTASLLWMPRG